MLTDSGRYFCESCERRYDAPGDCVSCEEEPLLDLHDDEVVEMLRDFDYQREQRWFATVIGVGAIPTVLAAGAGFLYLDLSRRGLSLIAAGVMFSFLGVARAVAPPRKKTPV